MLFIKKYYWPLLGFGLLALLFLAFYFGWFGVDTRTLTTGGFFVPYIITVSALLDSVNPCAFSILFLTVTFLFTLGHSRRRIIVSGGLYILGIFLVYLLIGLGILQVLTLFNVPNFLSKIGAVAIMIFGLLGLLDVLIPNFPIKLKIPSVTHGKIAKYVERGTYVSAFILGVLVGLFEFPCTGGPYLFILSVLHDQASFWKGFGYLLYYNLIFILPLVVILLISVNKQIVEQVDKVRRLETKKGRFWVALTLLLIGLIVFIL